MSTSDVETIIYIIAVILFNKSIINILYNKSRVLEIMIVSSFFF